MTNIDFLKEHIEQVQLCLNDLKYADSDDSPQVLNMIESIEKELTYWKSILKELKALKIMRRYVDADSFSGLSPENKELLREVL